MPVCQQHQHIDIDFTFDGINSDDTTKQYTCLDDKYLMVAFGDINKYNKNGSRISMEFNTANWQLYEYSGSQLVNTNAIPSMAELNATGIRGVSDSGAYGFVAKADQIYGDYKANLNQIAMQSNIDWYISYTNIPSDDYFALPDTGEYENTGVVKTARFVKSESAYLNYKNHNRLFSAGSTYEVGFECNELSGSGLGVEVSLDGTAQSLSGTGYDASTHTYAKRFTASSESTDFSLKIGTTDANTAMLIAKPYVKLVTNGTADGINYIHDITSNTVEYIGDNKFATDEKQWNRVGGSDTGRNRNVMFCNYSAISPSNPGKAQRITFDGTAWRSLWYYDYYYLTLKANTVYKLSVDYRYFYGDDLSMDLSCGNGTIASKVSTYDHENRKAYLTVTIGSTDVSWISMYLSSGNGTCASIGHAYLYECNNDGTPKNSDSLIDDISTLTLDTSTSNTEYAHVWNTHGYEEETGGMCINFSDLPTYETEHDYFSSNDTTEKSPYFKLGDNNWQVITYKDNDLCLQPGTYRLTLDQSSNGTPTVQLRKGTSIESTISAYKDITKGNTRTLFFNITEKINGMGLYMGNAGLGDAISIAFKNIRFEKIENGKVVSDNMVEIFCDNYRYSWNRGKNRTNSESTCWTPINCNPNNFTFDELDKRFETVVLNGDVNYDGTVDIIDLVALDDIYTNEISTYRSDINNDELTDASDVTKLGKIILGVNN